MANLHQGIVTEAAVSPQRQVLHSKDSLQKGLDSTDHADQLLRRLKASLRFDRTECTGRTAAQHAESPSVLSVDEDFKSPWPMEQTTNGSYLINDEEYPQDLDSAPGNLYMPSFRQPSASYLANVTPVRVESKVIYAPMRVMTMHLKGIKDFPNGPLSISCIGLSGTTIGVFNCHWDCKFAAIRGALGQQFEMEEHKVRLISAQGVELLDNMLVNGLMCGNFVEQGDEEPDDDVEDALIRSRMELKHSM